MGPNILELILDGRKDPTNISLALLGSITDNFSEERVIGHGRFGTVYKGVLPNSNVAVKRIAKSYSIPEKLFYSVVDILFDVNHTNVLRCLGYCDITEMRSVKIGASRRRIHGGLCQRFLCFEYISNEGLDKYLSDELRGLQWDTRYQIIKQICDGVNYLHNEKKIIHLDLKPSNILLDDQMTPKIADFCQSRWVVQPVTPDHLLPSAYCAPEFKSGGELSAKADIYSLGAIIVKVVTGYEDNCDINNVLRRWRHRWQKTGMVTPLAYQQVTKCIEIGLFCQERDPRKRPSIQDIIHYLNGMEVTNRKIIINNEQISPYSDDDMLGIEPLKLHFPFELNKQISCSVELTNETSSHIAFNIRTMSPLSFCIQPNKGIVPPRCKCSVEITLQSQVKAPEYMQLAYAFVLQSSKVKNGFAAEDIIVDMFSEKAVNVVDEVNLDVIFDKQLQSELLDAHNLDLSFPFEPHNSTPKVLTQDILKAITCNFSSNSELGRGGYGVVYKGVFPTGEIIAVKKLFEIHLVRDDQFRDEVSHLTGIKHVNVVQTLGYCAETSWDLLPQPTGRPIWAETPKRLICFEYVPNKGLDKYISDESVGLEWNLRYKIIKGICKGLHFLHEECHIAHLDLKPENILMDAAMVPKIADFGLSKIFGDQQTRLIITDNRAGSLGYMAPEYSIHGLITTNADIFSLGVIIIQIVTGRREYPLSSTYFQLFNENYSPQSDKTSFQDYMEKVVGSWRKIFTSTEKSRSVEKYIREIKQCISIALKCVDPDMVKRPTAKNIIQVLSRVDKEDLSDSRAGYQNCQEELEASSEPQSVTTDARTEDKSPRDMQCEDEFIVWNANVNDGLAVEDEDITKDMFCKETCVVDDVKSEVFYAGESTGVIDDLSVDDIITSMLGRETSEGDYEDRDYDVAALANNLSHAFRYGANDIDKDVYCEDESAEVVVSSIRLGDDQEGSLFANSDWFTFDEE